MSITKLTYQLSADASGLSRELRFAARDVERFSRRSNSNLATLKKGFGALAGIVTATLAASAREAINTGTAFSVMADETGVAVEDLSRLQFAMDQTTDGSLDLSRVMQRFNNEIVQAATGTGRAADAAERFGIALRDDNDQIRSQVDILGDVADQVAGTESAYKRAEIASSFFGRQMGQELLPLLLEGRDGIEDLGDEAERLGITFDQQTADGARELSDAIGALNTSNRALMVSIGQQMIPGLSAYVGLLAESAQKSEDNRTELSLFQRGFNFVLKAVEGVRVSFVLLGEIIGATIAENVIWVQDFAEQLMIAGRTTRDFFQALRARDRDAMREALEGGQAAMERQMEIANTERERRQRVHRKELEDIIKESAARMAAIDGAEMDNIEKRTQQSTDVIVNTHIEAIDAVEEEYNRLANALERELLRLRTPLEEYTDEVMRLDDALELGILNDEEWQKLHDNIVATLDPFGELSEAARMEEMQQFAREVIADIEGIDLATQAHLESLQELLDEGLITWEQYSMAVQQAAGEVEAIQEVTEETSDLLTSIGQRFVSDFSTLVTDPFSQNIEQMATNFIQQISRMVVETAVQRAVLAGIGGGFSEGGLVTPIGFSSGGYVRGPGTTTSDSIPAYLSNKEYVLSAETTKAIGVPALNAVNFGNAKGFAMGGLVGGGSSRVAAGGNINVIVVSDWDQAIEEKFKRDGDAMIVNAASKNAGKINRVLGRR